MSINGNTKIINTVCNETFHLRFFRKSNKKLKQMFRLLTYIVFVAIMLV